MNKTAHRQKRMAFPGRRKKQGLQAKRLSFEPLEVRQMLSLSAVVSPADAFEPVPGQLMTAELTESIESVDLAIGGRELSSQFWQVVAEMPSAKPGARSFIQASQFASLTLDAGLLQATLADAPLEFTAEAAQAATTVDLPAPDGSFSRFAVVESPIMEPALAAKFPEIKTYAGQGIDDPAATVRFDVTPSGFHALVLSSSGAYYVEPQGHLDTSLYVSYYNRDYVPGPSDAFDKHEYPGEIGTHTEQAGAESMLALPAVGDELRTYQLAVAATAEYTALQGGTAQAIAQIATRVNQINVIYEAEVAVRVVLVGNNDSLIFTNPATDGYTGDGTVNPNGNAMMAENQTVVDNTIGTANYDIGHVFGVDGGGVGGIGVVGDDNFKAWGVTLNGGLGTFAHEVGHQFGADHTFNSVTGGCSGNRVASAAYEPGSGTTIMSYGGSCGTDLVGPRDLYFHSESFDEIVAYTHTGDGNDAAAITATGNNIPEVWAGYDYTIPAATPFELTAGGSGDIDPGDVLTYTWEQRDLGPGT